MASLRVRLLSKTVINWETGCWEWTGNKALTGYGTIKIDRKACYTHRVAYELIEGPIPQGLVIDHLCRNHACINPAHLEPVTIGENTRRSPINFAALNARKTHCSKGHEFTPENTYLTQRGQRQCRKCGRGGNDPRVIEPCGTYGAAQRHKAHDEPLCEPCGQAYRNYQAEWARKRRAEKKRQREEGPVFLPRPADVRRAA